MWNPRGWKNLWLSICVSLSKHFVSWINRVLPIAILPSNVADNNCYLQGFVCSEQAGGNWGSWRGLAAEWRRINVFKCQLRSVTEQSWENKLFCVLCWLFTYYDMHAEWFQWALFSNTSRLDGVWGETKWGVGGGRGSCVEGGCVGILWVWVIHPNYPAFC